MLRRPMLRRSMLPSALLLVLAVASCGPPAFDVDVSGDSTIDGGGLISTLFPPSFGGFTGFNISDSTSFKNQGISKDQVESVTLKSLTLSTTAPGSANFDFLDSISFSVSADGQAKKVVARITGVQKGLKTITLSVEPVELAPYVTAEKMSLTTDATGRPPQDDTTVHGVATFTVVPNLF